MEIKILKKGENEIEVQVDSLTIAEILRVYLNKDSNVALAVWKREHPSKPPILFVKTKGKTPKKAIEDAINAIEKELNKISADFKKLR